MATELSNYANDYRVRYRITTTTDDGTPAVRWDAAASNYNVVELPDEAEYSMYHDGDGTADDPFVEEHTAQGDATTITAYYALPAGDGLGPIQGRYSLNFVNGVTGGGSAGFNTGATNPSSGDEVGDAFYNTAQDKLYVWNGTSWVDQA